MSEILESLGLQKYGYEQLYNGFTGKKIPALIFIGPIYYQTGLIGLLTRV